MIPPPCPLCGRTYYDGFAACWRDPAHGQYYSDLRMGRPQEVVVQRVVENPEPETSPQPDLFSGAA